MKNKERGKCTVRGIKRVRDDQTGEEVDTSSISTKETMRIKEERQEYISKEIKKEMVEIL